MPGRETRRKIMLCEILATNMVMWGFYSPKFHLTAQFQFITKNLQVVETIIIDSTSQSTPQFPKHSN
jgi:hypothetical protein